MRYQLPQFIEVEDKIFGPLTIKQFIYVAGGIGLSVICFLLIPYFYISIIPIGIILAFSGALAFYKINNKPFIFVVESATRYFLNPKLYIWKKTEDIDLMKAVPQEDPAVAQGIFIPKLSDSKLKDLVWSLDIREASNPITGPEPKKPGVKKIGLDVRAHTNSKVNHVMESYTSAHK